MAIGGKAMPATTPYAATRSERELPVEATAGPPVKYWAGFGAICVAFIAYVLIRWVTGPYFHHVAQGPTPEPGYMKASMLVFQTFSIPAALALLYWKLWRPWRRERTFTFDGLFAVALLVCTFQDPVGNYFSYWFTYNSGLWNRGSWVNSIPGWNAFGAPGHMLPEPLLMIVGMYVWVFLPIAIAGCWAIRATRRRWPRLTPPTLVAIVFLEIVVIDIALEALITTRLGLYTFAGGRWTLFGGGHFYRYPLEQAIFFSTFATGLTCLRYFVDDRGHSFAERGIELMRGGTYRKAGLRLLAIIGATQLLFLTLNNLPVIVLSSGNEAWPKDIQQRSYFLDGLCGQGTGRLCPGPNVPFVRGVDHAAIGAGGTVVLPAGQSLPRIVPFDNRK
jgi:hypothetical protein